MSVVAALRLDRTTAVGLAARWKFATGCARRARLSVAEPPSLPLLPAAAGHQKIYAGAGSPIEVGSCRARVQRSQSFLPRWMEAPCSLATRLASYTRPLPKR